MVIRQEGVLQSPEYLYKRNKVRCLPVTVELDQGPVTDSKLEKMESVRWCYDPQLACLSY